MELGAVQVVAELVNRIFDSEKYEEFPLSLVVDLTCMMNTFIEFFYEFFLCESGHLFWVDSGLCK